MRTTQRIDKIISNSGFGTRKEVKELFKSGAVKVDGKTVKDGSFHVNPEQSTIEVGGQILKYSEFIYLMMNKPAGVISATFDNKLKTVVDILPDKYKCFDLFPVGRLDIDTEGLLIMTNDGLLAHNMLSPKKHVSKTYYAIISGVVDESDINAFKSGVILDDGYKTLPAGLRIIKTGDTTSNVEIVIFEGKFHQVKRMFEAVGKKVVYLKRIKMGELKSDESLPIGECRELTDDEILYIQDNFKK